MKDFIKYTLLNVLGMIGLSCYILADTYFISKGVGAKGLTALNLALPVYSVVNGSGLMLGMGGATKYSIFKGQKAFKEADHVFTNTVYLAVALAVIFVFLGLFASEKLAIFVGADAEVFAMTHIYLKVILLFSPAFLMNNIFVCFVRNDGNPRLAMAAMLFGSFSNIVLDYMFIFPLRMGIFGAVLATGGSPLFGMMLLSMHKLKKHNGFHFRKEKMQLPVVSFIISLGFPSLITEISSGMVILVFNKLIWGLEGNVGIAAYGVVANLSLVIVSIHTGIAQGMQPLISRAYGTGNIKQAKQNLHYGVIMVLVVSVVVYLLTFILAEPVTAVFNSERNDKLEKIAVYGIRLYFTSVPFVGLNIVLSSFFTSIEKAVPAHVISLLRGLLLVIPAAFLLAAIAGLTGVWLAVPVTETIVCLMGTVFFIGISRRL